MPAPEITDEMRAQALEKARRLRRERAELMRRVKAGEVDPLGVLMRRDEAAGGIRVHAFLKALPGIGETKAARMMAEYGISEGRRLRGLGARQRERVVAAIKRAEG